MRAFAEGLAHRLAAFSHGPAAALAFVLALAAQPAAAQDLSPPPAQTPPRTVADILARLARYPGDESLRAAGREVLGRPLPRDATPKQMRDVHLRRAQAARSIGDSAQEVREMRRVVEYGERLGGDEYYEALALLATALSDSGNFAESIALRERSTSVWESNLGRRLTIHAALVSQYLVMGDMEAARRAMRSAQSDYSRVPWTSFYWMPFFDAAMSKARSRLLLAERKYDEAEAAARSSVQSMVTDQQYVERRTAPGGNAESVRNSSIQQWNRFELDLAQILVTRGRPVEAELVVRNVLDRTLQRYGAFHSQTAVVLGSLASVVAHQGRFAEADALAEAAVRLMDAVGFIPAGQRRLNALRLLGSAKVAMNRWPDALATFERIDEAMRGDPSIPAWLAEMDFFWGISLVRAGRSEEAARRLEAALPRHVARFGAAKAAATRGALAVAYAKLGNTTRAQEEFQRAIPALLAQSEEGPEPTARQAVATRLVLEAYVEFLFNLPAARDFDPISEAFRVADVARGQALQEAIVKSAARSSTSNPAIAALSRREQDLQQEIRSLYSFVVQLDNAPEDQRLASAIATMQERIAKATRERQVILDEISRRFPRYADLLNPAPVTLEKAREALAPGQLMVSIFTTPDRTFVWSFERTGPVAAYALAVGEAQWAAEVKALRAGMALSPDGTVPPFDLQRAHRVYSTLLARAAASWPDGFEAIVVAAGALAQLPLHVLVTQPHAAVADVQQPFGEYRKASWLARRLPMSYVATANSFVRLRETPMAAQARSAFAGFGDPVFSASAPRPGGREMLRSLNIMRIGRATDAVRVPGAWPEYSQLSPLPDTREEILAIAAVLRADPQRDVFLGASASRTGVLGTKLDDRRVVAFATHGLIAGDLPGLEEPGLALSASADGMQSPVLTMADILTLKLNADVVVLSACNTAAADGDGADALSGLARAFFYAGSRSLLVTHWPVETVSARLLTTGMFERYSKADGPGRARSLQQSMLALMDSPGTREYSYAHPLFWAPFVIVGDAGR